jgi:hypothetical protein
MVPPLINDEASDDGQVRKDSVKKQPSRQEDSYRPLAQFKLLTGNKFADFGV